MCLFDPNDLTMKRDAGKEICTQGCANTIWLELFTGPALAVVYTKHVNACANTATLYVQQLSVCNLNLLHSPLLASLPCLPSALVRLPLLLLLIVVCSFLQFSCCCLLDSQMISGDDITFTNKRKHMNRVVVFRCNTQNLSADQAQGNYIDSFICWFFYLFILDPIGGRDML